MKIPSLGAAAIVMAFALPASASVVTITYAGTVTNGDDGSNLFNLGRGASLTGDRVKVVYTLDASLGYLLPQCVGGDCSNELYDFAPDPSPLTASVIINGTTFNYPEYYSAVATSFQSAGCCSGIGEQVNQDPNGYEYILSEASSNVSSTLFPLLLDSPFSISLDGKINTGDGFFTWGDSFGSFTADHVSLTLGSGVPEPATWMMMLAGLGALGLSLRLSRSEPTRATPTTRLTSKQFPRL